MAEAAQDSAEDGGPSAPESQEDGPDYEGLLLRAGYNYHVFIAAAFGFLRGRGAGPDELIGWLAERLAPTWAGLQGHGADAILNLVLENLACIGYQIGEVEYGADESRADVGAIPLGLDAEQWQRLLQPFGATPNDMHALFRVFAPLAQSAGATFELAGLRDALRITVRRDPGQQ